jgi:hypothetical protein
VCAAAQSSCHGSRASPGSGQPRRVNRCARKSAASAVSAGSRKRFETEPAWPHCPGRKVGAGASWVMRPPRPGPLAGRGPRRARHKAASTTSRAVTATMVGRRYPKNSRARTGHPLSALTAVRRPRPRESIFAEATVWTWSALYFTKVGNGTPVTHPRGTRCRLVWLKCSNDRCTPGRRCSASEREPSCTCRSTWMAAGVREPGRSGA